MADRAVVYRLRAEVTQFKAQLAQASAASKKLANDLTAIDKEGAKTRRGLDTLGSAAGKVGLVAAAGLGAAVLKAANFDQAMSNVQAATHETTENMNALREAALQAGADTAFSATEAAAGIENLAKAGVSTQDILGGGLAGALDLAAAGGLDVASSAEIAATALTQFKLSGEDVPHVADLLAAGAGKAQGEVSDLGMALNQSGLIASQMGLTIEETTGSLAAFASAGLLGSDAGTSLKTMLLRLANPSEKAARTMEMLGINAYDANGNLVSMSDLAGQLQTAFVGMEQGQRDAALATIFGSDAIRAANVLYSEGEQGISDWTDKVNDSGYAAETAATKMDNLKGDLEEFLGSLETALIGVGDGSQGPLRSLVQNATDAVNAFNDLPEPIQGATTKLLALTAVTGGALWFGAKVIGGIANARGALQDLGITAGTTRTSLTRMARTTGGLLALAAAVTAVGNAVAEASGAKVDTTDLDRDLEALAGDRGDLLGRITDDLEIVNQLTGELTEPVKELVTGFGLFGNTNLDNAKDNLSQIDAALASMVESGNGDQAAEIFERIMAASDLDDSEVTEYFDSYQTAVDNASVSGHTFLDSFTGLPGAIAQLTGGEGKLGKAVRVTAAELERQEKALKQNRKRAKETAEEFIGLGDGLDDAKVSLGEWLKQLEDQADALRNFRINAEKAAKKGLDEGLILSLQEAGTAGALRMRQLANATDEEIERANRAWKRGQAEIDRYVDAIGGVPPKVDTEVNLNTNRAMTGINNLEARLNAISDEDVWINIRHRSDGRNTGFGPQLATGGAVSGPGTATSDSIPAWLSNGEHVWTAREVANAGGHAAVEAMRAQFRFANGGAVEALHAQRFASGGQVGGGIATAVAPAVTVGGAQVRVFIDGNEVRAVVDERIADHKTYDAAGGRHRSGRGRE